MHLKFMRALTLHINNGHAGSSNINNNSFLYLLNNLCIWSNNRINTLITS